MNETQDIEKKSLRLVTGKNTDWNELAKDCVCFANSRGGSILIGIEDSEILPPASQKIPNDLADKLRKRIAELTVNVGTHTELKAAENGGEYIELKVFPSATTIASTTDGRYYIRISDACTPLPPDDLMRLMTDKPAYIWETKTIKTIPKTAIDPAKLHQFVTDIKASNRVSDFVKQKTPDELLDYYLMSEGNCLTNLGVLWVGIREDRAKLLYAPVIQFLKYDESGNRVNKILWDDFSLNPKELIESVWTQIPDWKEGIEISDGIFRKFVSNYEEEVVRELLANALVHRPYTTRGDVFINLYPDRLEVHNPGRLPIGVTPKNILHKTVKRNEHLAKLFYDLKLMEREGSGYDKMYETLLSNGKQIPAIAEGDDRVSVTIKKHITKVETVKLVSRANEEFQLTQREIICLGLIAQHTSLTAIEFSDILNLSQPNAIRNWLGRLPELDLVLAKGKTKGVEYFVNPEFLKKANFKGKTNLKKIEDHRLHELIFQDLQIYSDTTLGEIHERIGKEININKVRKQLNALIDEKIVSVKGGKKFRRYFFIFKTA
ncbi:MAG: putative DNA binding domain-containing protein [Bacteroidetes bacterium]|nr:putative DNA binding domain-containing protein [Bacteroidota bacterium]